MINLDLPPGKYFISHSYKDVLVREKMILELPQGVEPFIFPPISVSPTEFVSDSLIKSILTCTGMIYMSEGASAQSFWVAFERDYALRAGKPVYNYLPSNNKLVSHNAPPLDLKLFISYDRKDVDIIKEILRFLREQRHFSLWIDTEKISSGKAWDIAIEEALIDTENAGGYILGFLGKKLSKAAFREIFWGFQQKSPRTMLVGLGDFPKEALEKILPDPDKYYVQVVDQGIINNNRIDDLIVRLYWLIFRNQFPELVYD